MKPQGNIFMLDTAIGKMLVSEPGLQLQRGSSKKNYYVRNVWKASGA